MNPDLINASFESVASVVALVNSVQLLIDKDAKGFNVWTMLWWLVYGSWFIFYYDSLHQPYSRLATLIWVATYLVQTILSFYYRYRPTAH